MYSQFSPAAQRNQIPIAEVLDEWLGDATQVLEIGSGSGQHAVFFGARYPKITWHTSDLRENHAAIRARLDAAGLPNVRGPLDLDVGDLAWVTRLGDLRVDAVYACNCAHIMAWARVQDMIDGAAAVLAAEGWLILYGPFRFPDRPTAPSNEAFDAQLRAQDQNMGLRDFAALDAHAQAAGLEFAARRDMPENNFILGWRANPLMRRGFALNETN